MPSEDDSFKPVYQVKTLRHDARDDVSMEKIMMSSWRFRRGVARPVARLGACVLHATAWPPHPEGAHLYLIQDGHPVGFAVLRGASNNTNVIRPSFLMPQVRRRGLGKALYRLLIDGGACLRPDAEQTIASQRLWAGLLEEYPSVWDTRGPVIFSEGRERDFVETDLEYRDDDLLTVTGFLNGQVVGRATYRCAHGEIPTAEVVEVSVEEEVRTHGVEEAMTARVAAEGWTLRPAGNTAVIVMDSGAGSAGPSI